MMRLCHGLFALCALAWFAAAPAQACLGPGASHFLDEVPDNAPAGTSVIRVDFTNQGAEFREWQDRAPERTGERWLVGIARRTDRLPDGAFPVYARVSSCTFDFSLNYPPAPLTRQAYLVGRFERLNGLQVFIALGRSNAAGSEEFESD